MVPSVSKVYFTVIEFNFKCLGDNFRVGAYLFMHAVSPRINYLGLGKG